MTNTSEPTADPDSLVGQVIYGYEILKALGSGGMGEVYVARHVQLDVLRAFKVIRADVRSQSAAESRFRREARAMSRLTHPCILHVFDFGRMEDGSLYLVMQLIDGPDLQKFVDTRGPLPVRDAVRILEQIADALVHAHGRDIVHRDLKPQNVLLANGDPGQVRLIDFGLVKMIGNETMTKLTEDGHLVGSPQYMSPEQGLAGEIGAAADMYALGGLGYFLLSGQPPFVMQNLPALILAHCYETPERIDERCPHLALPPILSELLFACLAKDPAARPSAAGLLANLGAVHQELFAEPLTPPAPAPPPAERAAVDPSELIWSDDGLEASTDGSTSLREALHNQITAILLAIADAMNAQGLFASEAQATLARVHALQQQITDQEMDLALTDSRIEELGAPAPQDDAATRAHIAAQVAELKLQQRRELRALYAAVRGREPNAGTPTSRSQLEQLDNLVSRYLSLDES